MNFSTISNSELTIMNIIWDKNSIITAHEIISLTEDMEWNHSTVLTFLSRLCKKGLLKKYKDTEDKRSNVYYAVVSREEYGVMVTRFMYEKIHRNSDVSFIASLFKSEVLSYESLEELRNMLNKKG